MSQSQSLIHGICHICAQTRRGLLGATGRGNFQPQSPPSNLPTWRLYQALFQGTIQYAPYVLLPGSTISTVVCSKVPCTSNCCPLPPLSVIPLFPSQAARLFHLQREPRFLSWMCCRGMMYGRLPGNASCRQVLVAIVGAVTDGHAHHALHVQTICDGRKFPRLLTRSWCHTLGDGQQPVPTRRCLTVRSCARVPVSTSP
jgi:hypothetical protein